MPNWILVALLLIAAAGTGKGTFPEDHFAFSSSVFHARQHAVRHYDGATRRRILHALRQPNRDALLAQVVPAFTIAGELWFDLRGISFGPGELAGPVSFVRVALDGAEFRGVALPGSDFSHTLLRGVRFIGVDLRGAAFDGAKTSCIEFRDSDLSGASFRLADFGHHSLFLGGQANSTFFDQALTRGVLVLDGVRAQDASFVGARASQAKFLNSDLRKADFASADLVAAEFRKSNISAASFIESDLSRANLVGAFLDGPPIRLVRAKLDHVFLGDLDPSRIDVSHLSWAHTTVIGEEAEADALDGRTPLVQATRRRLYAQAETIYRRLADEYKRLGYAPEYRAMRIRTLEARRKLFADSPDRFWDRWQLETTATLDLYGTSWSRFGVFVIILLGFFTLLHFATWAAFKSGIVWRRKGEPDEVVGITLWAPVRNDGTVLTLDQLLRVDTPTAFMVNVFWLGWQAFRSSLQATFLFAEKIVNLPGIVDLFLPQRYQAEVVGHTRVIMGFQAVLGLGLAYMAIRLAAITFGGY